MVPAAFLLALLGGAAVAQPVVQTTSGAVAGVSTATVSYFKGIPFAASTAGANRFMPPQPTSWSGVFNASAFGPGCYQTHHNADVPSTVSEDCLNLNVYAPLSATPSSLLPVMLFMYGGAFEEGSNQGPFGMYDCQYIVGTKPVVAVTINYRLGALGFLAVNGTSINGNIGLLDQQAAMRWVQANIKAFGGDPTRVTIWGESAGAMSVGLHMISPGSKGLFHQAIMESNPSGFRYRSVEDMRLYGDGFCSLLNCKVGDQCNVTCMQSASLPDIASAWNAVGNDWIAIVLGNWGHFLGAFLDFTPVVDGEVVPADPYSVWASGEYNAVPMLLGVNNNEGQTFLYEIQELPGIVWEAATLALFGATDSDDVIKFYADLLTNPLADGRPYMSQVLTDFWFKCASQRWATTALKQGVPAYFYRYDHVLKDGEVFSRFGLPAICANVTCHAAELPMVFHASTNPSVMAQNVTFSPDEIVLEQRFVDYWTSFAITGNPNCATQPPWPVWDPSSRNALLLQTPFPAVTNASIPACDMWDAIGYDF